jgi:hypothetical protein
MQIDNATSAQFETHDRLPQCDRHYQLAEHLLSCTVAGEEVVMSLNNSTYYGLNAVGTAIWHLLRVPRSVPVIIEKVCDRYDVDPQLCAQQVHAFLDTLVEANLLRVVSPLSSSRPQ